MANISGASLTQIQQRLRDTPAYHPFDADTFCDWAMEAGDIVTVRRGEESYQSPVHSSHLVWRGKQNMELNASGTKERDAIARVSKQKYARGGYGMRQQKSLYYEFYSEDGYLHGLFEVSESHMRSEFEDVANSLRGEFEVTASHLRGEFEDVANGLRGEFEVTASHLRSEFNDTANSLRGEFEVTASGLRSEFEDAANSLRGEFEVTASHLRGEFNDTANSLRGEFEVTASHLRGEFEDANNSLRGEFEVTAASLRAQFEDTSNSLRSSIEAEAGRIGLVVEGYGADASVKRASIVLAINNGKSSTHIDADEVYIGNQKSTTVINGKLNAEDVTADYIQGKIADISTLQVNGITSSGSVSFSGTTTLSGSVQIQGSDGNTRNLATGIRTLYKASESEGVVTLQYIDFNGTTHDVTFNKAVATISGSWSDGTLTVSKDPNGSSTYSSVIDSVLANGQVTYANQILTVPVTVRVRNNGGSQSETGYSGTLAVGAGLAYTAGQNSVNVNAGSWSSGSITFSPSAGTGSSASTSIDAVLSNGTVTYSNKILSVPVKVMAKVNGGSQAETGYTTTLSVGAGLAYTAGQNSVNVSAGSWSKGSITFSPSAGTGSSASTSIDAVLSNGTVTYSNKVLSVPIKVMAKVGSGSQTETGYTSTLSVSAGLAYDAGYGAAHLTGSWDKSSSSLTNNNRITISKTTSGSSNSLSYIVSAAASIAYNSTTHKYTATAKAKVDGTQRGDDATSTGGTEAYDAGYGAAHLTGSWDKTSSGLTNNNRITISKTTSGSSNSLAYVISAAASISYNSSTHKYTATAQAKVDGTQRGDNATATGGTEAYDAGWSNALNAIAKIETDGNQDKGWFNCTIKNSAGTTLKSFSGGSHTGLYLKVGAFTVSDNTADGTYWAVNSGYVGFDAVVVSKGSSGTTLDYIGVDPNRPADAYILNGDKQPYLITSAKATYWFLIRAMSGTTILDSKYLGVGTNVSTSGGHNNPIKFTRGAAGTAPNTYTWSAIIGTNVTGSSTEYTFYY